MQHDRRPERESGEAQVQPGLREKHSGGRIIDQNSSDQTSTPHPLGKEANHVQQRQSPDDVVSHVELDELHDLSSDFGEALLVELYWFQFKTRCAAGMLPPETAAMSVTSRSAPASLKNQTTPRWKSIARKPPPERARLSFGICTVPFTEASFRSYHKYKVRSQLRRDHHEAG
jgi:hypothetical protein